MIDVPSGSEGEDRALEILERASIPYGGGMLNLGVRTICVLESLANAAKHLLRADEMLKDVVYPYEW